MWTVGYPPVWQLARRSSAKKDASLEVFPVVMPSLSVSASLAIHTQIKARRTFVGADVSRPSPIDRPASVIHLMSTIQIQRPSTTNHISMHQGRNTGAT